VQTTPGGGHARRYIQRLGPPVARWLLVVSDVPTRAEDVERLLSSMSRDFSSMKAELEGVARALSNRRTRLWSAFYAPVRKP